MRLSTNPKQSCVLENQAKTEEVSTFFLLFYLPAYFVSKAGASFNMINSRDLMQNFYSLVTDSPTLKTEIRGDCVWV